MMSLRPRPFYRHAAFTIFYSTILGLSPIYITKEKGMHVLAVNPRWFIISGGYCAFNSLFILAPLISASILDYVVATKNLAFIMLVLITVVIKCSFNFVYIGVCKYMMKDNLLKILNGLTDVGNSLNEFGIKRHYWIDVFCQMVQMLTIPVTYIVMYLIIISENNLNRPVIVSVFDIYVFLIVNVLGNQFILLLLVIQQNFTAINSYLSNFGKPNTYYKPHTTTTVILKHPSVSEIKLIMFLYDQLCGIASKISFTYGVIIAISGTIHLGDLLINTFLIKEGVSSSLLSVFESCSTINLKLYKDYVT
ncbi:hypothetical protein ILUMI_18778 [Ignelater luminosus]|uniref:Gustatory receptor n=1 Tax=Ignelater luminosus TaxID=2038154 RepID=A0A8K0CPF1_IGNLU|nr:hypothetical protein ILUMI_18778 [Ignelater luminosus]